MSKDFGDLLEYGKQSFAIEVKPARYPVESGELEFYITHNGQQWLVIGLLQSEIRVLRNKLNEVLDDDDGIIHLDGVFSGISICGIILQAIVDQLRQRDWPEACQENIDGAIVYLDCALQNLVDLGHKDD